MTWFDVVCDAMERHPSQAFVFTVAAWWLLHSVFEYLKARKK